MTKHQKLKEEIKKIIIIPNMGGSTDGKVRVSDYSSQKFVDLFDQTLEEIMPKRLKECDCEKSEFGYHTKDCTFFEQGFNQALDKIKAGWKEVRG